MNASERLKKTALMFAATDECSDEREVLAYALWLQLSGAAKDTLHGLVKAGPLWDGDVPSKSGRDELLALGLASKAIVKSEDGYQVANYRGYRIWKVGQPAT